MSCIQLDPKHYSTAFQGYVRLYVKPNFVKYLGDHIQLTEELFLRLIEWNEKAYNQRYGNKFDLKYVEMAKAKFTKHLGKYSPKFLDDDKREAVRIIKLLQSIDYQCSDSDAYEKSNDREELKELISSITHYCIFMNLGYEECEWTI